jgi:hypothetical protein
MKGDGSKILEDPAAKSANSKLPAFLAPPEGAPVYHGFPILDDSLTDGWRIGVITEFEDSDGCEAGDAFVVAPDDSRAGLVWDVGSGPVLEISSPDASRWGVYQVYFPDPIRTRADLIQAFRGLLPALREIYERVRKSAG